MPEVDLKQEEITGQLLDIFVGGTVKALNENTLYFVAVIAVAMLMSIVAKKKRLRR